MPTQQPQLKAENIENKEPTWGTYVQNTILFRAADQKGTSNDPKLVVEHGVASTFTPKVMLI